MTSISSRFIGMAIAGAAALSPCLALGENASGSAGAAPISSFGRTFGLPEEQEVRLIVIGATVLRMPMNLTSLSGPEKCNQSSPIACPPLPGLQFAPSLMLGTSLTPGMLGFLDLQAVTGFSNFNPQLSIGIGPAILVTPHLMVNPQLVYSPTFYYSNGAPETARPTGAPGETNHTAGLSVAFGFIRPPVLFCPGVAAAYDVTSKQWFLLFSLKVGTPLAIL
jgi:hypothetical protein